MKITKVIILGIDAIEYDLIEEWNIQNLKQTEYGKTELPLKKKDGFLYDLPATTIMWSSFITGKKPRDHKIQTFKLWNWRPLNFFEIHILNRIIKPIQFDHEKLKERDKQRQLFDKIKKSMALLGLKKRSPVREDIQSTTLFDKPNRVHLHIPVYDTNAFPAYKKKILNAIETKTYRPIFEMQCLQEFNKRTKEVFQWLKKNNWEVLMQYFFVLDGIQHVFFNNPKKIATFYIMFDEFVGKIKKMLNDETLLLIISDHGQKKGIHTPYGFYSVNKHLGLKNPKITDFRWIIEDLLK